TRFSRDWSSDVCSSDLGLARIARMRGGVREVARDADFPLGLGRVGRAGGSAEVTGVEDAGVLAVEASVLIEQLGADARAGAGGFVAGGGDVEAVGGAVVGVDVEVEGGGVQVGAGVGADAQVEVAAVVGGVDGVDGTGVVAPAVDLERGVGGPVG